MSVARLRVFAGPNGSGKSSLQKEIANLYPSGCFVNADLIERNLKEKGYYNLDDLHLKLHQSDFDSFINTIPAKSLISKAKTEGLNISIKLIDNKIYSQSNDTYSYEGSLIGMFARYYLLRQSADFSFETVMKDPSKIKEINEAKGFGYKTYLYFVCIDNPNINVTRVNDRVKKNGHNVPENKIIERYPGSLKNLADAIRLCDKCYLFDNSEVTRLIAKVKYSSELEILIEPEELPRWFREYVLVPFGL